MTKRRISELLAVVVFMVATSGFVRTAHADPNFDLWRSDSVCLRMLSFTTVIPLLGTSMSSGLSICGTKTPGTLQLTLPGSALGLPGVDLEFSGVRAPFTQDVTWSIDSHPERCIALRDPSGADREIFLDTVRGSLTMHYESLPNPMRDSVDGMPTANLLTVQPGPGDNRLEFGVRAGCHWGALGGTVEVRDFLYTGTIAARSALAELTPAPQPARHLSSLAVYPRRICQYEHSRSAVPINGRVTLSHPADGPEQIHLSASTGGSVTNTLVTIPSGQYGVDFTAEVAPWANELVIFYADTQDYGEEQSAQVRVSVYNDDIPDTIACGDASFIFQKAYDFEDDKIYPIPPKDAIVLASDLMGAFLATIEPPRDSLPLDDYDAQQCFAFADLSALQSFLYEKSIGPQPPPEFDKVDLH